MQKALGVIGEVERVSGVVEDEDLFSARALGILTIDCSGRRV